MRVSDAFVEKLRCVIGPHCEERVAGSEVMSAARRAVLRAIEAAQKPGARPAQATRPPPK